MKNSDLLALASCECEQLSSCVTTLYSDELGVAAFKHMLYKAELLRASLGDKFAALARRRDGRGK